MNPIDRRGACLGALLILMLALPVLQAWTDTSRLTTRNTHYVIALVALAALARGRATWTETGAARIERPLLAAAGVAYLATALSSYYGMRLSGIDFSIWERMLAETIRGRWMFSPHHGFSHLIVHQTWILLPLVPLAAVPATPVWLQAIHALALWAPAWLVRSLALRNGATREEALWLALAYLTAGTVTTTLSGGFRVESFYPLLALALLLAWDTGTRWLWPALFAFLCVKEDAAFYALPFFAYAAWRQAPRRKAALGAVALSAAMLLVDALAGRYLAAGIGVTPTYVGFWARYGTTMSDVALGMLRDPLQVGRDIASSGFWRFYGAHAFLPLLHPAALAGSLAGIGMLGTASSYPLMHGFGAYYPVVLVALAFYGWSHVLPRLTGWRRRLALAVVVVSPLVGPAWLQGTRLDPDARRDVAAAAAFLAAAGQTGRGDCVQSNAYPQLPDAACDAAMLDAACLQRAPEGRTLLVRGKGAFPIATATVDAFIDAHPDAALFRSGRAVVVPSRLLAEAVASAR
jgi:uncharacterized membrane protein